MNKVDKYLAWGLGIGVTAGIVWLGTGLYRQKQLLDKNTYAIKNVNVEKFSVASNKAILNVFLEVGNYTDISLDIKGYNFDVKINGELATKAVSRVKQHISAQSRSVIAIRLEFEPTKVLKAIGRNLSNILDKNYKGVELELTGFINAAHAGFNFNDIPVTVKYTLDQLLPL